MILSTIAVLIVASILMLVTTQSRITQARWESAMAFHAAESGSEYVLARLRRSLSDPLVLSGAVTGEVNGGTFRMTGTPTFLTSEDGRITNVTYSVQGGCGSEVRTIQNQLGVIW